MLQPTNTTYMFTSGVSFGDSASFITGHFPLISLLIHYV